MNKGSLKFTGNNICEVVEFLYKHREERKDIPFMKKLIEGCDCFVFWVNHDRREVGKKSLTNTFELRMQKGYVLSIKIESRDSKGRRQTDFKTIEFTGVNIVAILQFIEKYKELFITEGYNIMNGSKKISDGKMGFWWDCYSASLYLANFKESNEKRESGLNGYNFEKDRLVKIEYEGDK